MSRVILGGTLAVALAACGGEPIERDDSRLPDADPCDSCMVEETPSDSGQPYAPIRYVAAIPNEVMFYGEIDSAAVTEPRNVTVKNTTTSTVLVTRAYVVDVETLLPDEETGDAAFFSVAPFDDTEPLHPGDQMQIQVSFAQTSQQRAALLVVETTHPGYSSLVVSLSGKTFINF